MKLNWKLQTMSSYDEGCITHKKGKQLVFLIYSDLVRSKYESRLFVHSGEERLFHEYKESSSKRANVEYLKKKAQEFYDKF